MIQDAVTSIRTGRLIDYPYYRILVNSYRDGSITDDERFDLELALAKFETNSYYR